MSNCDKLKECIEENYYGFREEMLSLDSEAVFEKATEISAIEDVFFYMSTHNWVDEYEAAYLLGFTNPLKLIADAWEQYLFDSDSGFRRVISSVLANEDNEDNYLTVAEMLELREKYGEDVSFTEAILSEIIELEARLQELREECECLEGEYCFKE